MKLSPRQFQIAALAGCLILVFCWPTSEPEAPAAAEVPEEQTRSTILLRHLAKVFVARETAGGSRSLLEAAALFGELNRIPPASPELDGDPTDDEPRDEGVRLCREVITWVGMGGSYEVLVTGQTEAAVARLEAELRDAINDEGKIKLPDPSTLVPATELLRQAQAWFAEQPTRRVSRE
jgi:hypothetical protein